MKIKTNRFAGLSLWVCLVSFVVPDLAYAYDRVSLSRVPPGASMLDAIRAAESGNRDNPPPNPGSTAQGGYQMTNTALRGIGWQGPNGTWRENPFGITSREQYLANPAAQRESARLLLAATARDFDRTGTFSRYEGQTVGGVTLNRAAILDCGYFLGPGGCRQWLATGQFNEDALRANPGIQNYFTRRIAAMSVYDTTEIDGVGSNPVNNSNIAPPSSNDPSSGSIAALYCDPNVQEMINQGKMAEIRARVSLAMDPRTGYTAMGGRSIAQAAGVDGEQNVTMDDDNPITMAAMSCARGLMRSISGIFTIPSISDLLDRLGNVLCQRARTAFAQLTQPLQQNLYQSVNLDQFLPGMGSVGVGGQMGLRGGSGSVGTNIGIQYGSQRSPILDVVYDRSSGEFRSITRPNPMRFEGPRGLFEYRN